MFPGLSRRRDNCRVYPIASAGTRIALKGDDPDFIILELFSAVAGAQVFLPTTAPSGKIFNFVLTANPQTLPVLTTHSIIINVPGHRVAATFTWSLGAGQEARFIYTPNGWLTPRGTTVGADGNASSNSIAWGQAAVAGGNGIAVGSAASGTNSGVALGPNSTASTQAVSVGNAANSGSKGLALGFTANTNSKNFGVALGFFSKCERYNELVKSADGATTCLQSFSILDWYGDTANATPTEILLGGTAAQYVLLLNNSAFMFRLTAIARNNADDVNACWSLTGGIKRGAAAANTALIGTVTKTIIGADAGAATWDMDATADTTNGSLKLTVTGEAAKTIRWNVRGDISELRF